VFYSSNSSSVNKFNACDQRLWLVKSNVCHCSQVHRLYRTTGASFVKAQQEFAQGIVTNRTVQQTATGVAASAAQGAYGSSGSRY